MQAEVAAKNILNVEKVILDQENTHFLFYITENLFGDEEFPCFRGVILDKSTNQSVDPKSPTNIILNFAYSDVFFRENNIVEVCAD